MTDRRRATLAGLAAVPLLLLAAGCGGDGSAKPFGLSVQGATGGGEAAVGTTSSPRARAESATVSTVTPAPAATGDASELTGLWSGHYVCNQGPTDMKLTLAGSGAQVRGTFEFTPPAGSSNPGGSYTVSGTVDDGKVTLHGEQWVKQPSGYIMVDFEVTTISSSMLRGNVDSPGCTTFQVSKS